MNKTEFLARLSNALSGIPEKDREERLAFYSEMIDDRMEEGLTEEEAIAGLSPIRELAVQTVSNIPLTTLVKEKAKKKGKRTVGEKLLLVLGFPLWFPLLLSAFAIILSLYVVLWSVFVVSFWAVEVSFCAMAIGGVALSVCYGVMGFWLPALAMFGIGIFSIGFSIIWFGVSIAMTKAALWMTKKITLGIKSLFIRKETEE